MTESFDRADIKARAETQARAYEQMLELGGGVGLLGVREPEMFEDMLRWDSSTENGHADTVLALLAALDEAGREVERLKSAQHPCDGGCNYNSGPEETCSAHGRPVAEVWNIVEEVARQRDEAERRIAAVEDVLAESDVPQGVMFDGAPFPRIALVSDIRAALHPVAEGRANRATITIPAPHVPFGPDGVPEAQADADYLRSAVRNIRYAEQNGRGVFGSNLTNTVCKLLNDAAAALHPVAETSESEDEK